MARGSWLEGPTYKIFPLPANYKFVDHLALNQALKTR